MQCLLIETKDKRKFFTHEKHLTQLVEFSKTFRAQLSVVQLDEAPILELEELAPAICDPIYQKSEVEYRVVETKVATKKRREILQVAKKIQEYITNQILGNKIISLKALKKKFLKYDLTDAALCNHIRRVKIELNKRGMNLTKIGPGKYRAEQ